MAQKGLMDYNKIFDLYEIKRYDNTELHKIRQALRRYLRNYLDKNQCEDKTWDTLSEDEQAEFMCNYIQPLMTSYAAKEDQHRIACNIEDYKQQHHMVGVEEAKKLNAAKSHLFDCFDIHSTSSQKTKQTDYNQLCETLHTLNNRAPVPSYDDFTQKPLRPYDYRMDYEYGQNGDPAHDDTPLETYYIMQILLKAMQDAIGLEIDFEGLRDCIHTVMYPNVPELELFDEYPFPLEYDSSLGMPKTEYEEIKKNYLKYVECRKKLKTLDGLYTVKKRDPHK